MRNPLCTLLCCLASAAVVLVAESAEARVKYHKAFVAQYVDPDDSQLPELGGRDKCLYCHQGKKSKKNRNRFGDAMDAFVEKNEKDNDKIAESLAAVAAESSDPEDPEAPTWGELIAAGTLPGGPLEEVREEPSK